MGSNYAGVDWASERHDVLIAEETGEELLAATFAHDEAELRSLCRTLVCLKVTLVAIERPDGLLVERLLDAGLRVLALHPNQVAATRVRFRVSGGKSDRFDAFVLCELARTDSHRFRVLEPDSDQTKALRAMCRGREDLVQTRVALCNQLRAKLERFWPAPLGMFSALDSAISLAFLERYPSPIDARALGEKRLAGFLASTATAAARPRSAAGQAPQHARRPRCGAKADRPVLSLFKDRKSVITAATLLAQIGDCRARYPTADALAGAAGQGAVAVESGKRKVACFRWA